MAIDAAAAARILARLEAGERIGVTVGDDMRPAEIIITGGFAAFVREVIAENLKSIIANDEPPDSEPPDSEPTEVTMQPKRTGTDE